MKKYIVYITETLQQEQEILANSREEALELIQTQYHNNDIVLDYSDYVDTEFDVEEVK